MASDCRAARFVVDSGRLDGTILSCHRERATTSRRRPRGRLLFFLPSRPDDAGETLSDRPHHHHSHHHASPPLVHADDDGDLENASPGSPYSQRRRHTRRQSTPGRARRRQRHINTCTHTHEPPGGLSAFSFLAYSLATVLLSFLPLPLTDSPHSVALFPRFEDGCIHARTFNDRT